MKKLFKWTTLVVALSLLCTYSYANTTLPAAPAKMLVKVQQPESGVIMLHLANLQQINTTITLHDLEGTSYFRQQVNKHNGYSLKMSLSEVPDGRYIMRIHQANGQEVSQIIYKSEDQLLLSQLTSI
jgi:hypothetical protein